MGNSRKVSNPPGVALEIISQAAQDIGAKVNYIRYPNKRVQNFLQKGKVDGAFIFSYKKERLKMGVYPMKDGQLDNEKRIASISYYLYKQKGDSIQWDGKKITGLKKSVGANRGYSIVGDLKKMGIAVSEVKNIDQLIYKLRKNRISCVAAQDITTDPYLVSVGGTDIEKLSIPLKTKDYFLIFSHQFIAKNSKIAQKLWKRIAEIRDSKTKEIISKYKN